MKTKARLEQLKKQFERLRKDSVEAVGTANEILYTGLQNFADKELKALNDYYDAALASLKTSKKSGSLKNVVQTQFDLMQETVTRLIANARESLEAAADARTEPAPRATSKPAARPATKKAAAKKAAPAKTASAKAPAKKAASRKKAKPENPLPALDDSTAPPRA